MNFLQQAHDLSKNIHKGQFYDTYDYFTFHICGVVADMETRGLSRETLIVGYLHDVLEDSTITYEKLEDAFGTRVANAVLALTREPSESYMDYIERCSKNDLAYQVKYHDVFFNLNYTLKQLNSYENKDDLRRFNKYTKALEYLRECKI